jgi:hypothetical protein
MGTNANTGFIYNVNFTTLFDYFNVLVDYVKLILLMNRVETRKKIVCLYNLSFIKLNGKAEQSVQKIWNVFSTFESAFPAFQEKWFPVQDQIGKALINLLPAFERGTLHSLNIKRPLEMLSEPDTIPYPSVDDSYQYLCNYNCIVEWIAILYACCPDGLKNAPDIEVKTPLSLQQSKKKKKDLPKRALELLLQRVLENNFVICLYGDEVFDIHEVYKSHVMLKRFDLKSEKKTLKHATETAASNAHNKHAELRNYLRLQLKSLLNNIFFLYVLFFFSFVYNIKDSKTAFDIERLTTSTEEYDSCLRLLVSILLLHFCFFLQFVNMIY